MLNKIIVFLKGFNPIPKDKIAINSLSLFNLINDNNRPNIKINGIITVIKLGIKYSESIIISRIPICIKFVIVKSLVICSNQATDKKINSTRKKYLKI